MRATDVADPGEAPVCDLNRQGHDAMGISDDTGKPTHMNSANAQREIPGLPNELQGQIGKKLREAYTELVTEPVPDRFVQLLQQLKNKEQQGGDA